MIYDVLILVTIGLLVFFGIRNGAAKSITGLVMSIISYLGATFFGKLLAVRIYADILRPTIYDTVVNTVSDYSQDTLNDALKNLDFSSIDVFGLGITDTVRDLIKNQLNGPIDSISSSAGETADTVVEPIIIGILAMFLTLFLFFLFLVLLRKFLMPLILKVFKLPGIKPLNIGLGIAIGLAEAFLFITLIAYLLHLFIPQVTTEVYLLQESTINESILFKHFYHTNLFTTIALSFPF